MSTRTGRSMYYVDGSTVRKLDAAPDREYVPERRKKANTVKKENVRKNARASKRANEKLDRALAFDMRYTVFVVAAVLVIAAACGLMLYMESKVDSQKTNINSMEAELEALETDNAAYKNKLDNMYTLDEIYDVAANELGMVYAKKGQIVYYESANEDYVKQYQDVPDAE